jgi:sugar lactone lactonase YvrE
VPYNGTLPTSTSLQYFSFDVSTNDAYEATFQLLNMSGNADLVLSQGTPLPTLTDSDYGSFNSGKANENIYVLTNSEPVPLTPGTWYLGVFNRDTHAVNFTVLAQELDLPPTPSTNLTIIPLTNGVPFNWTAGPGAALTNFFSFGVSNNVATGITNPASIHFELYNLTGNGNLTVQTDTPPFAPPFFQSSAEPGILPEYIQIQTNNVLTNLNTTWYLGVPNQTTNMINYTIIAVIDTNNVFPAFPGAEGAGAGALGASIRNGFGNSNTVYHVVSLDDSGPGTLRDAVSSTNRTIVFDISGAIYLQSSLVITNSYLTIAGQTAPEGGITLAGAPFIVSTNVHDVVVRYLRLRPVYAGQTLYEADWGSGHIYEFTPNGTRTTFASGLSQPNGLTFDSGGNLFEAEYGNGNVNKFTPPSGTPTVYASVADQINHLTFDSASNLFVADNNGNIYKIPRGGGSAPVFASGLNAPWGVAFNDEGMLFSSSLNNDIYFYTPNGQQHLFVSQITSDGPYGLAFNRDGNLFVGDASGTFGGILKVTPTGIVTDFSPPGNRDFGVAVDNAGNVYAVDGGNGNRIVKVAPNGTQTVLATGLSDPNDIALAPPSPGQNAVGFGNALQFNQVSNVIADHISAMWSSNDDVSILNSSNVTVQWSIISDGIHPTNNFSGYGSVVDQGGGVISLHHNLYADNAFGNPQLGGNISLDFVNNVIYDWSTNAGISEDDNPDTYTNYLNFICNYLIASTNSLTNNVAFWGGTTNTWIYQTNNFIDSNTNGALNGSDTGWNMFTNRFTETNEFRLPPVSVDEAYIAYEKVLDFAGDSMFKREPAESNIVENVRKQSGTIIGAPGVIPTISSDTIFVDSANDGIPDFWKLTFGQAVTNADNNLAIDSSGYSELEEFDNWLAGPHALTYTDAPVGVDLMKMFGKTGSLSFFATNAINGTVYLTNVLGSYTNQTQYSNSIAIFTPTTGYSGYASFDVYVTNNQTVGYFGPVTVSVFVSAVPPTFSEAEGYLTETVPVTNIIGGNTTQWYEVSVPTNAVAATNSLLFAGVPMNLWYSTNVPPTTTYPNDFELLKASTNGSAVVNVDGAPLPPLLQPGGTYYLGVQNTNNFTTNYAVEVSFQTALPGVIIIGPGQPVTNIIPAAVSSPGVRPAFEIVGTNNPTIFGIYVPANAIAATNTFLFTTGGTASLWFNQNAYPGFGSQPGDYELINNFNGTTPVSAVLTSISVPPLVPGQVYYVAITNTSAITITNAFEVTFGLYYTPPILPTVTNTTVVAGNTLTVDDTGSDTNAGTLVYYLTTAPPVNATISNNGIITWNVPTNEPGTNVLFTTIVSNNFTLYTATNSFTVTVLPLVSVTSPLTNTVPAGSVSWLAVDVPVDAEWATNLLLYATNSPVNVLFTTNFPPAVPGAYTLMGGESAGISVLGLHTVPTNITDSSVYYLGIQNTSAASIGYALRVAFGLFPPPLLPDIADQLTTAGDTLVVTNTATDTSGVGTLAYTLTTSPSVNATISNNGLITWTTSTNQASTNILFTTIVTNSATTLSATNTFTVTVLPYKPSGPIVISSIVYTNIGGTNGFLLTWFAHTNEGFQVQETPALPPASWNTFSNIITYAGPLTATNGKFTFFDNGAQYPFGPMRYYRLLLLQLNSIVMPDVPNYILNVSEPLAVTNVALDSDPVATLTYYLTNFPAVTPAAVMNNGIITWTPTMADAGGAFKFTTTVTDNGVPPITAGNDFTVFVLPAPTIASATATATNVTLNWSASTNDLFQVQWTTNLNPVIVWATFPQVLTSTTGAFTFTDTNEPSVLKFYRLIWLPLP